MSATLPLVREAVYELFVAAWTSANPSVPIVLDNEKSDKPTATPWVRLTIRHKTRGQESLGDTGNRRFQSTANVFVNIYGLVDVGTKQCDDLAQSARDILEGIRVPGYDAYTTAAGVLELGTADGWNQVLLTAGLTYTEIR